MLKNDLADFYLEFINDWLSIEAYAEYHELSITQCEALLAIGRELHEERASSYKGK